MSLIQRYNIRFLLHRDLKQECGKGINRDATDNFANRVDNAALTRNAQFGVVQSQFRR